MSTAPAAGPAAATLIHTDAQGLAQGEFRLPVQGGTIAAYYAAPEGGKDLPVVLVLQEIFGIHEHIQDICRRVAKAGYLAVAANLYERQGDASTYTDIPKLISELVSKVSDEQVLSDLDASLAWAGRNGGDTKRVGVTGFCWGGRLTRMYAAHNPAVKAAVAWYGPLIGKQDDLHPLNPIDVAATVKVPILGLYGGLDRGITQEAVAQMRAKLKAAGGPSQIVVYPDAGHGFHADYRPSYNARDAADGDRRLLAWFKKYGVV